ncbi:hypothetical protein J3Q64DRAFT_1716085 [Phycomyces blakesleeanus]|uniref:FYVE-type domain-containing protein n=1 Tax=Phycomyces blakesleeanus TaxID=4837 RepID=A0ABR3BGN0_PHYBL
MDVYDLTRKKRPTHLTLGQSASSESATTLGMLNATPMQPNSTIRAHRIPDVVSGPPNRDHWKPDADSLQCASPDCQTAFGLFERRHHCRKCGDIFCSAHCSNYFRLDHASQFHLRGLLSRGCDACAGDYKQWQDAMVRTKSRQVKKEEPKTEERVKRRTLIMTQQPQAMEGVTELGRDDIVQSDQSSSSSPTTPRPRGIAIRHTANNEHAPLHPILSVPADWQWSTF